MPTSTPWWGRSLAFCAYFVLGIWAYLLLLPGPFDALALRVTIMLWFVLWVMFVVYKATVEQILRILQEDVAPHLTTDSIRRAVSFLKNTFSPRAQLIFSLVITGFCLVLILPFSPHFVDDPASLYLGAPVNEIVFLAMLVNVLYLAVLGTRSARLFGLEDAALFPLDARNSPVIFGAEAIARRLVLAVAIVESSFVAGFLLVYRAQLFALYLIAISFFLTVVLVGSQFVLQQRGLSQIITRQKIATLAELQSRLSAYYANKDNLTGEEREQFDTLMNVYKQVLETSDKAFDFGDALRYVSPLALPVLAFAGSGLQPGSIGDVLGLIVDMLQ